MPFFDTLKDQLSRLVADTAAFLDTAGMIAGENDDGLSGWKSTCQALSGQMDNKLRVAVVGAIKSGKSTLVNSLLGGDFLKRGAGVVTSIVTRVRAGDHLRASLRFKGWKAINAEVNQAADLLLMAHRSGGNKAFDLKDAEDRRVLAEALEMLAVDQLITGDTRSAGTVVLSCCLNGYDRVFHHMQDDPCTVVFENEAFSRHRDFVGDDALAVYLDDVLLEMDLPGLGSGAEIADCQGSDSPNPFHMAMIQDYLAQAHLIVYVVTSRTGVRQADIRFLSMIRRMGMMDMVTVVVNDDLNEHETLASLTDSCRRIESDLRILLTDPRMFSFSALFRLMEQTEATLSPRDRDRLEHWQRETDMAAFCIAEQKRFQSFLAQTLGRERNAILLKSHLERLGAVISGIENWTRIYHDLLTADKDGGLVDAAREQRGRLDRLKLTTRNTLDGALNQVKATMKQGADRFFDEYGDGVVAGLIRFIRNYAVDGPRQAEHLASVGFTQTLRLVFQEFRNTVDTYMAETVNPEVIRFIRDQENDMALYLDEVAGPLGSIIDEAMARYTGAVDDTSADTSEPSGSVPVIQIRPELAQLRNTAGLSLPSLSATLRYSVQIKSEAMMRLGAHKVISLLHRLFRRSGGGAGDYQDSVRALSA
ncbi:dynamin family protein, partial [Desulfosarcina sp. OttesenSCG-928-G17]|nr:dynamin family protein [Desulfosarcina sp. OttesenSCG-928-G17]